MQCLHSFCLIHMSNLLGWDILHDLVFRQSAAKKKKKAKSGPYKLLWSCLFYSSCICIYAWALSLNWFMFFFFHHTTCKSMCDTLPSSAANQGWLHSFGSSKRCCHSWHYQAAFATERVFKRIHSPMGVEHSGKEIFGCHLHKAKLLNELSTLVTGKV